MSSRRLPRLALLPALGLLGGAVCAVAPPSLAGSLAPVEPLAPVELDVPPDVGDAIIVLLNACAAWPPPTLTVRPPTVRPLAATPLAATPLAATPLDAAGPVAVSPPTVRPLAATPVDAGPVAVSPLATAPLDAAGPVAASPPTVSPLAATPLDAGPLAVSPLALRRVPRPRGLAYASAARTICQVAAKPLDAFFWESLVWAGVAGAVLFFFGLVFFSLLHGLLVSAWNWRPSFGEKSW